jgi:hypothetical protein
MPFSNEYAQFLCDRFYRRYKETAKLVILCSVCVISKKLVPASIADDDYDYEVDHFICVDCKKLDYSHSD